MRDGDGAACHSPEPPHVFFSLFALKLKLHAIEDHAENEICQNKALNHSRPAPLYHNMLLFISNIDLATFHLLGVKVHNSADESFFFFSTMAKTNL